MPDLQPLERVEHQRDARLHVEYARPPQAPVAGPARHRGKCAQRINRVVVTEQQHRFLLRFAGEINLQMIANIGGPVKLRASAQRPGMMCSESRRKAASFSSGSSTSIASPSTTTER